MTRSPQARKIGSLTRLGARLTAVGIGLFVNGATALAQTFEGKGLLGGIQHALGLQGIAQSSDIRGIVLRILISVLNFLALIAVVTIIIAGFYLVLSLGNDEGKDKAKKTIYYTLIGLAVILFARVIVGFITIYIASQVA
jgi:hypothetical protein